MTSYRKTIMAAAFAMAIAAPAISLAASACRDANGKFIKCPVQLSAPAAVRCKDAAGKFVKCTAPGAKPITMTNSASAKPAKTALAAPVKPTKSPVNPVSPGAPKTP